MLYDSGSFTESLDAVLRMIDYEKLRAEQPAARDRGRPIGIGISPYVEPTGWGSEGAGQSSWSFASHDAVRIQIEPSGEVIVAVGSPSQGQGHATSLAQLVAAALGAAIDTVTVRAGDTDSTPVSTAGTRASRTAVVIGGALLKAAAPLRSKLDSIAAYLLEAAPEDIVAADGSFGVTGSADRSVTVAQIAAAAYFDPALRSSVDDPDLSASAFYDPPASYSNGCVVAVVEVDAELLDVKLRRLATVEDCGTMLNPMLVEGQVCGAIAQGVGGALLEQMRYDSDGRLETTDMRTYKVPKATDLPPIEIAHECSPSPFTVGGIKGMGESGAIAAPAAVANAVADALSHLDVQIERLPIDPDLVTDVMKGAR